ncbi:hypothetical protein PF005_g18149 [Phytophthora fragariae]|uniref:Uncharacterized protein n=2 Tax=Phytophthora TaxID=4783 RepID=A0A6A4CS93_9STRA|nr:hypothetical protein PF009_g17237 [Phytophthora fragariae]KAE9003613.1 hypothetical protein PR002_g17284 [Phytophthora rubi]KAE9014916.1 hypothetical protein PF011_g7839 [Phytophthora fragariae]KAE9093178.1 hypothetical protein PF010_g17582 [Phytophthora fragariae]KAE9111857.1 hypothetical protein PF007_g11325 [Phytophthora fragariae]
MTAPPLSLSFYRRAPQQRVAIDDFEDLGHKRIKLLSQVTARWSTQSVVDPPTQEFGNDTNADQLSHYALRLAFCSAQSLERMGLAGHCGV